MIHVSANGEVLQERDLPLGPARLRGLALYADVIPPTVTITRPERNSYVSTDTPELEVAYEDARGLALIRRRSSPPSTAKPITATCSPPAQTARCVPDTPLPQDFVSLAVTVADHADNLRAGGS